MRPNQSAPTPFLCCTKKAGVYISIRAVLLLGTLHLFVDPRGLRFILISYVRTGTSVPFFSAAPPRCTSTEKDSDDVGESGMRFLMTEVNSATTLRYTNQACSGSCWSASKRLRRKTLSCKRSPVCFNMFVHTPVCPFLSDACVRLLAQA